MSKPVIAVIPAKAGIQSDRLQRTSTEALDPHVRFRSSRGDDEERELAQ
jgi:hypothetical protein